MTRNRAIDILNGEKKVCETTDENSVYINEELFTPDVLDLVISDEGYNHLLKIIENMDYSSKETIKLKMVYGYSNDEIADIQNTTKRTIEMRLYRGRVIIKEILKKEREKNVV